MELLPLPHSYIEVLIHNVTIFGDSAFKKVMKIKGGDKGHKALIQ